MKKRLIIALTTILLLILNLNINSATVEKKDFKITFTKNIIYVDDNNTNGPWDGSIQHPFQYIHQAINNSTDKDLIYVFSGVYHENFIIDKKLTIVGENKSSTIIDGVYEKNIINITSENVYLENFTIRNTGGFTKDAGIIVNSKNNLIKNCTIYRSKIGLFLKNSKNNTIENCTFHTNAVGVLLESSSNNFITTSCFGGNAIAINSEKSDKIIINYCYAHTNGIAILLNDSKDIEISHCNISDNTVNLGGIFIIDCINISLKNNIIRHNGVGVSLSLSKTIEIINCDIVLNTHYAIIMRRPSKNVLVSNCNIKNNLRYGFYIEKGNSCIIEKNNIEKNNLFGIYSIFSKCVARKNWWGSFLGPSYLETIKRDKITFLLCKIRCIPWSIKPFKDIGAGWKENDYYMVDETFDPTEKEIIFPEKDSDNDNVPDWWEEKWGYNPNIWDDHKNLDPDKDGLDNIEECFTDQWGSNPFIKDIFLEIDWLESTNTNQSNKPSEELFEELVLTFEKNDINLHFDTGKLGGGEEIPFTEKKFSYTNLVDIYWDYFLHNDLNNPRKGIFRYAIICSYCPDLNFPFFGWNNLDSIAVSADWLKLKNPLISKEQLITGAIIHHLGHTLRLIVDTYEGIDNQQTLIPFSMQWWKYYNYKSCMNYKYKYKIFTFSDGTHGFGDFNDWNNLDFSFFKNTCFKT
ncbi:MAG: pectinesterase family protein [Candidatus Thermoplasmatota archaeon]|jgi:parallel beta-helix repeat protein|nr:pectinesterase family protein [Candidatus Thermoplasmatota archaeon]